MTRDQRSAGQAAKSWHVLVWERIQWVNWLPHLGRPGWWKMAAVMMREEPISGRQGQAPLIPSTSIQMPVCVSQLPLGLRGLYCQMLPSPSWSKSQTLSDPSHLQWRLLGLDFTVSGSAGTPAAGFFLMQNVHRTLKRTMNGSERSWLHHWASLLALFPPTVEHLLLCGSLLKA